MARDRAAPAAPKAGARGYAHPRLHHRGPCYLIFRPPSAASDGKAAWEATCPAHGRTGPKCKTTLTMVTNAVNVDPDDGVDETLQMAYHWRVLCLEHGPKQLHGKAQPHRLEQLPHEALLARRPTLEQVHSHRLAEP